MSFDKAEYLPGEAATITVTPVDAAGLPLSAKTHANLFATGGITSTYAFGSGSDVLTGVSVTTDTSTVKTFKVFMPLTENTVTISATGGTIDYYIVNGSNTGSISTTTTTTSL